MRRQTGEKKTYALSAPSSISIGVMSSSGCLDTSGISMPAGRPSSLFATGQNRFPGLGPELAMTDGLHGSVVVSAASNPVSSAKE